MERAGVVVEHDEALLRLTIVGNHYRRFNDKISSDYTSASYFLASAALSRGTTILTNMRSESLQGERAIVDMLCEMGIHCHFDPVAETLTVENRRESFSGEYEFDVSDCPNIVPTLAALGSFVESRFRVIGASITRFYKSQRVDAIVTQLRKMEVDINPVMKGSVVDGFEIHGRHTYEGWKMLSSWFDHRVFMSLVITSLHTQQGNAVEGLQGVDEYSPGILSQFSHNGADLESI